MRDVHDAGVADGAATALLGRPDPPTAFFTAQNLVTVGAARALCTREVQESHIWGSSPVRPDNLWSQPCGVIFVGSVSDEPTWPILEGLGTEQMIRHVSTMLKYSSFDPDSSEPVAAVRSALVQVKWLAQHCNTVVHGTWSRQAPSWLEGDDLEQCPWGDVEDEREPWSCFRSRYSMAATVLISR
jgi:hypothetical protein